MDNAGAAAEVTPARTVERFRRWGTIAWSSIGVVVLAGAVLWVLTRVGEIFPPLVVALVVVFVLNPVVTRLEKLGVRRLFGSCLSYLVLLVLVGVALTLLIPALIDQGQSFMRALPRAIQEVSDFGNGVSHHLERVLRTKVDFGGWVGSRSEMIGRIVEGAGGFFKGAIQAVALVVVGLVVGFYLLIDLPRLRSAAVKLLPPHRRDETRDVAATVAHAMGGFFRGQLLVALIVGVLSSIGLRLIGLPYWLVVGMIAGLFNLVPLVGPFVGAVPAIFIAATFKPPIYMVWAGLVLLIVQQIDNHVISPNVMRVTVRLHPVTVMLSLIGGAALAGFWGMLLAVPVVASAKVVAAHYWRTRVPWGEDAFEEAEKMETIPPEQESPAEAETRAAS